MSRIFDTSELADALQTLGKRIQDPEAIATEAEATRAIRSIASALGKLEKSIGRDGAASSSTNISLTLYAARQLELYVCGKKTQISNHRMAEIYYKVLCAGVEQLPRADDHADQ
jgi:hypothetical protein